MKTSRSTRIAGAGILACGVLLISGLFACSDTPVETQKTPLNRLPADGEEVYTIADSTGRLHDMQMIHLTDGNTRTVVVKADHRTILVLHETWANRGGSWRLARRTAVGYSVRGDSASFDVTPRVANDASMTAPFHSVDLGAMFLNVFGPRTALADGSCLSETLSFLSAALAAEAAIDLFVLAPNPVTFAAASTAILTAGSRYSAYIACLQKPK